MFGYVNADLASLSGEDRAIYRSVYCGVCRSLRRRYGIVTELSLSYDMVFLSILLLSVYGENAEEGRTRCVPHPVREHPFLSAPAVDYAADMGLVLMYYKFLDDWQDDRNALRYTESRLIRARAEQIGQAYPRQCGRIRDCLRALSEAEARDERNPDVPAGLFGALMGELFVYREDGLAPLLWETGRSLGVFVYLCDAALDLKDDIRKKRYNPLTGLPSNGYYGTLCAVMGQVCACYKRLPVDKYRTILDNILYSGVWTRWDRAHGRDRKNDRSARERGDGRGENNG